MVNSGVDKERLVNSGVDKERLVNSGVDKERLVNSGVDKERLVNSGKADENNQPFIPIRLPYCPKNAAVSNNFLQKLSKFTDNK